MNKLLSSLNFPAFPARLSIYTLGHFYFEFMANYFLVAVIGPHLTSYTQMVHVLVIYNCFDYGCQIFIGLCDDIVHRNHFFAAIGAFLFAIAYFFHASAFIAAAVIGLGAAFIHVPLGRQVLSEKPERYAYLAPFVASGAFGVFLGKETGFGHLIIHWPLALGAAAVFFILCTLGRHESSWNAATEEKTSALLLQPSLSCLVSIALLVSAIAVQSFTFAILQFTWDISWIAWISAIAILLSKGSGGLLADRFGYERTIIASTLVALLCAAWAPTHAALGIVFLLAIHIPSATVIVRLAHRLGPAIGTGFGLFKLFHLLGFLPTLFFPGSYFLSPLLLIVLTLITGILMLIENRIGR